MKFLLVISLAAAMLMLTSCVLGGKAAATPVVPAPPAATAAAKPPAPPPVLSTPQTDVHLPPAQVVTAEALATIQVVEEAPAPVQPPAARPATRTNRPQTPAVATAPKNEPPAATPPAVAETTPPPTANPPVVEEQPRLQPVYTDEEKRRVMGELEKRKGEIEGLLKMLNPNRISADQKSVIDRIQSFITVAETTAQKGDLSTADKISERALILARELSNGR